MQPQEPSAGSERRRAIGGGIVVVLALGGAAIAIWRERHSVGPALRHLGAGTLALAAASGLVGVLATYPVWWQVLDGLGVRLPAADGARLFYSTQLGKYIPGSVWPALMQMEAGRIRGASRATMLAANVLSVVVSCTCGLIIAAAILPVYSPNTLDHYWWGLLAVPVLAALLHPRIVRAVTEKVGAVLRRPGSRLSLDWRSELAAAGWSVLSWVGLGFEAAALTASFAGWSFSVVALGVGAMAIAVSVGILFIPAPAGAGVRDVVLALVLSSALPTGKALAVVLAARVILVGCDLIAAALTLLIRPGGSGAGERTRTSTPLGTRT